MDLKALSLVQVKNTFSKYEEILRGVIQVNTHVPDRMITSDIDYLTILWILVTEEQKFCMYDMIRSKFTSFLGDLTISNVSLIVV